MSMIRRFRVEVTRTEAFFIDAIRESDAIEAAVEQAKMGARPAYQTEPQAVAEICAEAA